MFRKNKNIMQIKRKTKDILAVDFSGEEFVLAHMKVAGKRGEFVNLINYSIHEASDGDIAKILQKAVQDLKIKNPYIVNVIPLHLAITKNLEIPSVDAQEIKEIVDLQSGRQTPYAREEIVVDYINIGTFRQSYTKILLAIVTRSVIKRQCDLMEKAGFKVENIFFAPEGITHVCMKDLKADMPKHPSGIVHINSDFTDFIVAQAGAPIFTRSVPIGIKHFRQNKEEFTAKFIEELRKSLQTYQSEDIGTSPQIILLTGALEQIENISTMLAAELHIPAKTMSYLEHLPLNPKVLSVPTISPHVSFLNVTSVLSEIKSLKVDLIPDEIKLKQAFERRVRDLIAMAIYLICILVLGGAIFITKFYFRNLYLSRLKDQYQTTSDKTAVLEKSMERLRIIKHYLKNRGYSLGVLSALYDILPKQIMITDVKMDTESRLNIKGTAKAMSDVFSFVVALEETDYFSNVQTNYTSSRKEKDEDWADFGISCMLEGK